MPVVTVQEAQTSLAELIHRLLPGEEVVIMENNQPVARLLSSGAQLKSEPRKLGTLAGTVKYLSSDFDAPLEDFREYME